MNQYYKLALVMLVLLPFSSCKQAEQEAGIKNLLVIIGDDHSARALGCYGNDIVRTPNLDRLADEGVMFTNAYSNAPVCSASRQSLLTGKYPHSTGVTLLRTPFSDEKNVTIAEHLRSLGYTTGVVGKTHFNNRMAPVPDHGFTHNVTGRDYKKWFDEQTMSKIPDSVQTLGKWKPFVDSASIWLNADVLPTAYHEEYGSAAYDAMKAIEFLKSNKDSSFFLWVGFHEPHSPFNFPLEYAGKYDPSEIPLPVGSKEDDRFVPEIFRGLSDQEKQGIIASYYTSVEYMDHQIGKILDALKAEGLSESTLVVYLGDQGYLLGDHKRFEKHTMWDPAAKAPLIFRVGEKKRRVKSSDALLQFIDVVPTILDILDTPPMETVQGISMEHLFNQRTGEGNDYVFAEFLEDNKAMVTDGKWKYIFTTGQYDLGQGYQTGYGPSGILHKLYDLDNDPEETTNIAELCCNDIILASLQKQMLKIFTETYPDQVDFSDTLTLEEKLIWFCEPRDEGASRGHR
jgi:choline-sulfatase